MVRKTQVSIAWLMGAVARAPRHLPFFGTHLWRWSTPVRLLDLSGAYGGAVERFWAE